MTTILNECKFTNNGEACEVALIKEICGFTVTHSIGERFNTEWFETYNEAERRYFDLLPQEHHLHIPFGEEVEEPKEAKKPSKNKTKYIVKYLENGEVVETSTIEVTTLSGAKRVANKKHLNKRGNLELYDDNGNLVAWQVWRKMDRGYGEFLVEKWINV